VAAPAQSTRSLQAVAESDPTVRPLALLQLAALESAAHLAWALSAEHLTLAAPSDAPLLHDQSLPVDLAALEDVLLRLLASLGHHEPQPIDALALLHAAITRAADPLLSLADEAALEPGAFVTLAHHVTLPLLLAIGTRVADAVQARQWHQGYCPTCGDWPVLAELRGLERARWLRCGRCASAWRLRVHECAFCGNLDHVTLGYLAAEDDRESRRAVTCRRCQGYLKTFTTVTPLAPADLLARDLSSVELDIAAHDAGFGRPERPGWDLHLDLVPLEPPAPRRWWQR
jgi:FdhE protein